MAGSYSCTSCHTAPVQVLLLWGNMNGPASNKAFAEALSSQTQEVGVTRHLPLQEGWKHTSRSHLLWSS